jgi:hypothetical protein
LIFNHLISKVGYTQDMKVLKNKNKKSFYISGYLQVAN